MTTKRICNSLLLVKLFKSFGRWGGMLSGGSGRGRGSFLFQVVWRRIWVFDAGYVLSVLSVPKGLRMLFLLTLYLSLRRRDWRYCIFNWKQNSIMLAIRPCAGSLAMSFLWLGKIILLQLPESQLIFHPCSEPSVSLSIFVLSCYSETASSSLSFYKHHHHHGN